MIEVVADRFLVFEDMVVGEIYNDKVPPTVVMRFVEALESAGEEPKPYECECSCNEYWATCPECGAEFDL